MASPRAALQPEPREPRKLLRPRPARIDREPAGREPELPRVAGGAPVGGAEHRHPVVLRVGVHHPEAGEARARQPPRRMPVGHVEERGGEQDLPRRAVLDDVDLDRLLEVAPRMEEPHLRRPGHVAPERRLLAVADLVVQVVVDALQQRGLRHHRRGVGQGRQAPRRRLQVVERERRRRPQLDPGREAAARQERQRPRGQPRGDHFASCRHLALPLRRFPGGDASHPPPRAQARRSP
jgi:hypothetical protein